MQDDPDSAPARQPALERRLATIMMADVVGYSRMVGENEERTIEVLRGHREVFDEFLKLHRGRIFNTAGDAVLAEFPSAVEAVRCATEAQSALRTRNDHLPPEQKMQFRIGINLGDVIVQDGDLLGDGVNVAARIQSIAEPGGICISGSVYDQIQNKLSLQFRQLGERSFKNIAQPVRTFAIADADGVVPAAGAAWRARRKSPLLLGFGAVLAAGLAAGGYVVYRDHQAQVAERARTAETKQLVEKERAAAEATHTEATLQAELQAARNALQQAELAKVKAEQEKVAAETAQREARLQSELKAAKDALAKAEQSERKANAESRGAAVGMALAEKAARLGRRLDATERSAITRPEAPETAATEPAIVAPQRLARAGGASKGRETASAGVARYDGEYFGHMCSVNADNSPRCWKTAVTVQNGVLSTTWSSRLKNTSSHGNGAISADGAVSVALDGHSATGRALTGNMTGRWNDDTISVTGAWSNNVPINATWKRAR